MKVQNDKGSVLDELLKRALADDLPSDVAAGMRDRAERFRAEKTAPRVRSHRRVALLSRTAWATLALLMLIAGFLLQGARASSPLADRISSFKAAYAGLEPARR